MTDVIEGDWFDPKIREQINEESIKRTGVKPFDSPLGDKIAQERAKKK